MFLMPQINGPRDPSEDWSTYFTYMWRQWVSSAYCMTSKYHTVVIPPPKKICPLKNKKFETLYT